LPLACLFLPDLGVEVVFRCVLELVLDFDGLCTASAGTASAAILVEAFLEMRGVFGFLVGLFGFEALGLGVDLPLPLRASVRGLAAGLVEVDFLIPLFLVVTDFVLLDTLDWLLNLVLPVLLASNLPVVFCACFLGLTADFTFDFGIENWMVYHTNSRHILPRKIAVKYGKPYPHSQALKTAFPEFLF